MRQCKLLLETGNVDVNARDTFGQSPFFYAELYRHDEVVKLLLETGKVNVDARDSIG